MLQLLHGDRQLAMVEKGVLLTPLERDVSEPTGAVAAVPEVHSDVLSAVELEGVVPAAVPAAHRVAIIDAAREMHHRPWRRAKHQLCIVASEVEVREVPVRRYWNGPLRTENIEIVSALALRIHESRALVEGNKARRAQSKHSSQPCACTQPSHDAKSRAHPTPRQRLL